MKNVINKKWFKFSFNYFTNSSYLFFSYHLFWISNFEYIESVLRIFEKKKRKKICNLYEFDRLFINWEWQVWLENCEESNEKLYSIFSKYSHGKSAIFKKKKKWKSINNEGTR